MEKISVTTGNKNTFYVSHYSVDTKPKAIVQILHGMAEHQRRYHDFINLTQKTKMLSTQEK